jgi:ribonuclease P protein component
MRPFVSLRRPAEFDRLRRRGRRTATDALIVYRSDSQPADRLSVVGFTVSKAVGNAVVRNLVKRRLVAITGEILAGRPAERLLFIAAPSAAAASFAELRDQVRRAIG